MPRTRKVPVTSEGKAGQGRHINFVDFKQQTPPSARLPQKQLLTRLSRLNCQQRLAVPFHQARRHAADNLMHV